MERNQSTSATVQPDPSLSTSALQEKTPSTVLQPEPSTSMTARDPSRQGPLPCTSSQEPVPSVSRQESLIPTSNTPDPNAGGYHRTNNLLTHPAATATAAGDGANRNAMSIPSSQSSSMISSLAKRAYEDRAAEKAKNAVATVTKIQKTAYYSLNPFCIPFQYLNPKLKDPSQMESTLTIDETIRSKVGQTGISGKRRGRPPKPVIPDAAPKAPRKPRTPHIARKQPQNRNIYPSTVVIEPQATKFLASLSPSHEMSAVSRTAADTDSGAASSTVVSNVISCGQLPMKRPSKKSSSALALPSKSPVTIYYPSTFGTPAGDSHDLSAIQSDDKPSTIIFSTDVQVGCSSDQQDVPSTVITIF